MRNNKQIPIPAQWQVMIAGSLRRLSSRSTLDDQPVHSPGARPRRNRRTTERVTLKRPAQGAVGRWRFFGEICDISEGGARSRSEEPLRLNSRIKLFVPLPLPAGRARMAMLDAVVVRKAEGELGVQFMVLSRENRLAIRELVQTRNAS